jgi:hypothetical protein
VTGRQQLDNKALWFRQAAQPRRRRRLRQSAPERPESGKGQAHTRRHSRRGPSSWCWVPLHHRAVGLPRRCQALARSARYSHAPRGHRRSAASARGRSGARAHGAESVGERRDVGRAASMPQGTGPATHAKLLHILLQRRSRSRRSATVHLSRWRGARLRSDALAPFYRAFLCSFLWKASLAVCCCHASVWNGGWWRATSASPCARRR